MEQNTSPYQIRLEVLRLVHNDCMEVFREKLGNSKLDPNTTEVKWIPNDTIDKLYPTADQITKRAEELYKFICKKDR